MLYYSYGTSIVSAQEAAEEQLKARSEALLDALRGGRNLTPLDLPNGQLSPESVAASGPKRAVVDWQPIGLGKPLTIEVREVYTGKYPNALFGKSRPMVLASAVKNIATFDSKPLALNFILQETKRKTRLTRPRASHQGTPIIYYSPAMTDLSITVDLSMAFDEFPQEFFDTVSKGLRAAAGIPVFLTQSLYMLAASEVTRIAGALGSMLFDGRPAFEVTAPIDLALPGAAAAIAGFMLVTDGNADELDPSLRRDYHIFEGKLIDANGRPYPGEVPYVVLAVDGTPRADLASFGPTALTAAMLSQYYGLSAGEQAPIGPLLDALRLYSDMDFRSKADKLGADITKANDPAEKAALEQRRDALIKNIYSDFLRP